MRRRDNRGCGPTVDPFRVCVWHFSAMAISAWNPRSDRPRFWKVGDAAMTSPTSWPLIVARFRGCSVAPLPGREVFESLRFGVAAAARSSPGFLGGAYGGGLNVDRRQRGVDLGAAEPNHPRPQLICLQTPIEDHGPHGACCDTQVRGGVLHRHVRRADGEQPHTRINAKFLLISAEWHRPGNLASWRPDVASRAQLDNWYRRLRRLPV